MTKTHCTPSVENENLYKVLLENVERNRIKYQHTEDMKNAHKPMRIFLWVMVALGLAAWICVMAAMPKKAHAEDINMDTIAQIESNFNPHAYNKASKAKGMYQITPIVASEIRAAGIADVYGEAGASWYMNVRIPQMLAKLHIEDTTERRLVAYNAGIGVLQRVLDGKRDLKTETKRYIKKYKAIQEYSKQHDTTIAMLREDA